MERDEATTSSALYGDGRGAGGKLRKPPSRRPPATPYNRPLPSAVPDNHSLATPRPDRGWLSKLVDPAYRLISGGANRILPSLFSKPYPSDAPPAADAEDHGVKQDASIDVLKCIAKHEISTPGGIAGPNKPVDRSWCEPDIDQHGEDKASSHSNDDKLCEIEDMLKGKRFSREEIDHLIEILHSRVGDLSNVQWENKKLSRDAGVAERFLVPQEKQKLSIEEKNEDLNKALWAPSTPLFMSTGSKNQDEVGASPVEIARAYMGSRTPEIALGSKSITSKDNRPLLQNDEFALKPFIPSSLSKSSACWPGSVVEDRRGCFTPKSERSRFGLHNFPRTPYSRTVCSKSKTKLPQSQGDNSRYQNISSSPLQLSRMPYGQVKSRTNVLDDGYGSIGPIRRIRHKFASETLRESVSFRSSQNGPLQVGNSNASEALLPVVEKHLELRAANSCSKFQSANGMPHGFDEASPIFQPSNQVARKILEHIDGNRPTPKEKSAELHMATRWKKPLPSEITKKLEGSESHNDLGVAYGKFSSLGNRGISVSEVQHFGRINGTADATNKNTEALDIVANTDMTCVGNAGTSTESKEASDSFNKSAHEAVFMGFDGSRQKQKNQLWPFQSQINGQDASKVVSTAACSDILNRRNKLTSHSLGANPVFPSISIDKPVRRCTLPSDNSFGFTFPVSASVNVFSEPPTPSILPLFSASDPLQSKEGHAIPSYTFGAKQSTPSLVFSFPSTSNASTHVGSSDLKFNFGSDRKTRVSFSPVGNNGICS